MVGVVGVVDEYFVIDVGGNWIFIGGEGVYWEIGGFVDVDDFVV